MKWDSKLLTRQHIDYISKKKQLTFDQQLIVVLLAHLALLDDGALHLLGSLRHRVPAWRSSKQNVNKCGFRPDASLPPSYSLSLDGLSRPRDMQLAANAGPMWCRANGALGEGEGGVAQRGLEEEPQISVPPAGRLVGWRSSPGFPPIAAREMNARRPTQRRHRAARLSFITLADEPSGRLKINVTEGDAGQTLRGWLDWARARQGEVEGSEGRSKMGLFKTSVPLVLLLLLFLQTSINIWTRERWEGKKKKLSYLEPRPISTELACLEVVFSSHLFA